MGAKFQMWYVVLNLTAFFLVISHDLLNHSPVIVYRHSFGIAVLNVNKFTLRSNAPVGPYELSSHWGTFESTGAIRDSMGRSGTACGCLKHTRMNCHLPSCFPLWTSSLLSREFHFRENQKPTAHNVLASIKKTSVFFCRLEPYNFCASVYVYLYSLHIFSSKR